MGAVTGVLRGFVHEMLALAAWIFALFAIHTLHTPLGARTDADRRDVPESGSAVLSFTLLLLVPYAVVKLMANWLGSKSRNSLLGPIDRVLGFGFGGCEGPYHRRSGLLGFGARL